MFAPAAASDTSSEVQRLQELVSQLQAPVDVQGQDPDVLRAHGETVLPVGSGACSGAPHAKFDPCRVEHLVGGASRRDARCSHVSHGYRGQRVREASHPAPVRRLRRSADVRNVFPRLATQSTVADSEVTDVVVPVRDSELHVLSDTEPRAPVRPSRRGGVGPRARGHSEITSRQLQPTSS